MENPRWLLMIEGWYDGCGIGFLYRWTRRGYMHTFTLIRDEQGFWSCAERVR